MFDKFEIVREVTYYTLYADGIAITWGYLEDIADVLTDFARDCKDGQGGKEMLSHDYLSEFFTDYVTEHVINEFCNLMEDTAEEKTTYHFMRGCAEPHLKLYDTSDEVFLNYKLEGVVICNLDTRETKIYDITGLVSTLNGGNIRISAYESRPY